MSIYETVFIARQELSAQQVEALTEQYSKIITDAKGKILKTESWGLRTLAYRINKNRKGHYALIESDVESAAILEIERQMRLDENVLRYLTTRLEKPTEGPSVILDKGGEREDKRDDKRTEKKFEKKEVA
jgi:small subunit ribosomal protein S6|tara:strand:+ start:1215 stop:1604 length:390 start_codon:yes stop_codon:yes gene_type:complete